MKSQKRLRLRIPPRLAESAMLKVAGKPFRCVCGSNVFKPTWCAEHQVEEYKCCCGRVYG